MNLSGLAAAKSRDTIFTQCDNMREIETLLTVKE